MCLDRFFVYISFFLLILLSGCQEKKSSKTTGYAEADLFYLSSASGGYLKDIKVHEGDDVAKGDELVELSTEGKLIAPASSKIIDIFYQKDEYVMPGYPMISLQLPKRARIIFFVPEKDLSQIKIGKKVTVYLGKYKYTATISTIGQQAEYTPDSIFSERNKSMLVYKIKATLSKKLQKILKPGQPVDIDYE